MRTSLFASAALLGLAIGSPAFAQSGLPTATTPLNNSVSTPNGVNQGVASPTQGVTSNSVPNGVNRGRAMAAPGVNGPNAAVAPGSMGTDSATGAATGTTAGMEQPGGMKHSGMAMHRMHRMNNADVSASSDVGTGNSTPASGRSSNISQADTRSEIAPRLPMPNVGPNADAQQYVSAARRALQQNRTGAAQEALERAETRLLDRSTQADVGGMPASDPMVKQIADAREALGRGDRSGALTILSSSGSAMPMNSGAATPGSMGTTGGAGSMGGSGTMSHDTMGGKSSM